MIATHFPATAHRDLVQSLPTPAKFVTFGYRYQQIRFPKRKLVYTEPSCSLPKQLNLPKRLINKCFNALVLLVKSLRFSVETAQNSSCDPTRQKHYM